MNKKNRIKTIIFSLIFGCTFLLCVFKPNEEFSIAERRPLKSFPALTVSKIQSGRFMEEFEDYVLDQFPFRDGFREIKAWMEKNIFLNLTALHRNGQLILMVKKSSRPMKCGLPEE